MALALIDAFIYFVQLGSCARLVRHCFIAQAVKRERLSDEVKVDENVISQRKFYQLSEKTKEMFTTWFELCRNILSELLIYPLLIFDLFDFITDVGYKPDDDFSRTDFSLFVIGGFYLILAVYIMRVLMVAGSMISLIRIPAANNENKHTSLLIQFSIHVLGQIAVHLMVILAIAVKINNENPTGRDVGISVNMTTGNNVSLTDNSDAEGFDIHASPFLILVIILGWIIPFAGVVAFFVVNYYWMMEFSVSFWLNMVSLLQGEGFAETVFGGEGLAVAKDRALELVDNVQYTTVKKQLKRFKSPSFFTKFFFPIRIPLIAVCGLLYDIILLTFVICLMLTCEDGSVKLAIFREDNVMTSIFMISIITTVIANLHVLILLNIVLVSSVFIVAMIVTIATFISPVILFVFIPIIAFLGYLMLIATVKNKCKQKQRREWSPKPDSKKEDIPIELNTMVDPGCETVII